MEKSIDDLILDLKDSDDFVKEEAIGMLELKGEEAVEPLIAALDERNKDITCKDFRRQKQIGKKRSFHSFNHYG